MAQIIEAQVAEDSDEGHSKPKRSRKRRSKPKKTDINDVSDPDDASFSALSRGEGESSVESENDIDVMEITNEEVCRACFSTTLWYTDLLDFICS